MQAVHYMPTTNGGAPANVADTGHSYAPENPHSLLNFCQRTLEWTLYNHRHQPINLCWIDHPYGEEEIKLLEEGLMPVLSKLLRRIEEIDTTLETEQQAQLPSAVQVEEPDLQRLALFIRHDCRDCRSLAACSCGPEFQNTLPLIILITKANKIS